jgi:hypothetical protein
MTVHTLPEILRLGRQHDPDGVEVVMSRQACEEAADQLETLDAYKERARRLFECLEALCERVAIAAAHRHVMDIDDSYMIDGVELIAECTAITAVEGFDCGSTESDAGESK